MLQLHKVHPCCCVFGLSGPFPHLSDGLVGTGQGPWWLVLVGDGDTLLLHGTKVAQHGSEGVLIANAPEHLSHSSGVFTCRV